MGFNSGFKGLMFLTNITFKDCRHFPVMKSRPSLLAFMCDLVKKQALSKSLSISQKEVQQRLGKHAP